MNNFGEYITAEKAFEIDAHTDPTLTLSYYQNLASQKGKCEVCGQEEIWRLAGLGMCFSCITGEADASEDYELVYRKAIKKEKPSAKSK